jgi:hypothetical protein
VPAKPPNVIEFVGRENENLHVTLARDRKFFDLQSVLQRLFELALLVEALPDDGVVLFQLLLFVHYHFLFSVACLMRCHLSEALASARAAIDAALIAAYIIKDRDSQVAYVSREPPFKHFGRHLGSLIRDGKAPHRLVPALFDLHKELSAVSSHADIGTFMHRAKVLRTGDGGRELELNYFQFSLNEDEREIHGLDVLCMYVMILDVFSDYLVSERKCVPEEWSTRLHSLGATLERSLNEAKDRLAKKDEPNA